MTRTDAAARPAAAGTGADTRLRVRTVAVDETAPLVPRLDPRHPLLWMRRGEGIIGLGEVLRIETRGPDRIADAARQWRRLADAADLDDRVGLPGSGLVAFGAIAFADESAATSVLVVPEIVLGRRDGRAWVTRIERLDAASVGGAAPAPVAMPEPAPKRDVPRVRFTPGAMPPEAYTSAVGEAVRRIDDGRFEKVVLARQLVGELHEDAGLRAALAKLADDYPDTWVFAVDGLIGASPETLVRVDHGTVSARVLAGTYPDTWVFAVDGLIGASPETLVRVDHGTVSARVLAGTTSRGRDAASDREQAARLAASHKDLAEHALAVESAVATLAPHTARLDASPEPFTLQLPNLWHLATDLKGTLGDGSTSLDLVAAVHPTAAVAGTPRSVALAAIAELEGFDRGRYAGPVGWVDADGDGEWAIALRCAQVHPDGTVHAYAGCGIVHDSVPADELAETGMKFRPIVEAFGAPPPSPPVP